jgi:2-methylisocitrate lyase-like PEP mutase family enzyme
MKTTAKLRQLLHTGPMVVAPFILNAMHAKIAEAVGFPAVYMTGAGTAAERGFPDVGLLTMSEMVTNARYIADAVQIPVICDADTGYGNPHTVGCRGPARPRPRLRVGTPVWGGRDAQRLTQSHVADRIVC